MSDMMNKMLKEAFESGAKTMLKNVITSINNIERTKLNKDELVKSLNLIAYKHFGIVIGLDK